jgi:hypothetical protein
MKRAPREVLRIQQATKQAKSARKPVLDVVVAEGIPPKPPARPRLVHCVPDALDALPTLRGLPQYTSSNRPG